MKGIIMDDTIFFKLTDGRLPSVSLCDTTSIKPPYIHFKRQSSEFILYYIHSGELCIREDTRRYTLTSGDYILLCPRFEHEGFRSTSCTFTYVHFSADCVIPCMRDDKPALANTGHIDYDDLLEQFELVMSRLLGCTHSDAYHKWLSVSSLCELLGILALCHKRRTDHALSAVSRMNGYVTALSNFLNTDYSKELSSQLIEEMFHCNFDYLNRIFKRKTGETIFVTLNRIRIRNAKKYLATGLYTCSEAAALCGFHDSYYFSKVFKKYSLISPSEYRQRCLDGTAASGLLRDNS